MIVTTISHPSHPLPRYLIRLGLDPGVRAATVRDRRGGDTLSLTVHTTHGGLKRPSLKCQIFHSTRQRKADDGKAMRSDTRTRRGQ